ncbi:MAG: DUF1839 family protein [Gaiellaceae bacterium]
MLSLLGLDPDTYRAHRLHDPDRAYPETNCYTDILIELVHAHGDEPLAAFGGTVRTDFEGDQWTFFKPERQDLERLFGIDIHEMQLYRPLHEHLTEQLRQGRSMIVELDSWYLPDTQSTAYRREHVKSSAVIEGIDVAGERLRYFHNAGLYELSGADYRGVLRLDVSDEDGMLPPYAELLRFDAGPAHRGEELRDLARALLREHMVYVPRANPFVRFGASLAEKLPELLAGSHADYHAYAFATVRQAGASFASCATYLEWLFDERANDAAAALARIVEGSKVLSFKLARRRQFDLESACAKLAADWDEAMSAVAALCP